MYNSWVEVSRSSILHNLTAYQRLVGKNIEVVPILKSNAYGHGMPEIAKLVAPKVRWLGTASLGEALALRQQGIRKKLLVLSYAPYKLLAEGIRQNISLPLYDIAYAKQIHAVGQRVGKPGRVHIKIDTGATRVGARPESALDFIRQVSRLPGIKIEGLWSHFASSEDNQGYSKKQLWSFARVLQELEAYNIELPYYHFACSAATVTQPLSRFNMIRLGLSLYGLWPSNEVKKIARVKKFNLTLRPAMTWKTKIIQVKDIPNGTKIGYGGSFTAKKKMRLAVLAAGYWEGYDRKLSNTGEVLVHAQRCPVVGRVCMNIMMVDVSKIKNAKAGDEVVLLGRQGQAEINAEELAEKIGTINYEVVTRVNPLLPRVMVK